MYILLVEKSSTSDWFFFCFVCVSEKTVGARKKWKAIKPGA